MRRLTALTLLLLTAGAARAQAPADGVLPIGDPVHAFLERQHTRGLLPGGALSHQPLSAYEARAALDSLAADSAGVARLSPTDRALLARYRGETDGPGIDRVRRLLPALYRNGHDLFSTEGEGYGVQAQPWFYLDAGYASQSGAPDVESGRTTYRNTRGIRAAGHLGPHVFFETRVEENQRVVPTADLAVTGQQIGQRFFRDGGEYDYWVVTGLVGVRSKYVEARFGRDRNQWGQGGGDLLLSGFPTTYDQLQVRTHVGRLHYTNVFSALQIPQERDSVTYQERARYGVFHRLALDLPGRVQIGLAEAAILAPTPDDRGPEFYFAYLNPIIFLRALDFELGSPANMLIAADVAWVPTPGVRVYGQFMLDEFRASELFSGRGWRNNKWGALGGVHVAGLLVPELEVRAEWARIRPYTYSSMDLERAPVHNFGLLGHPFGPNSEGVALWADYRPTPRLTASVAALHFLHGRNDGAVNWGGDPLVPYTEGFPQEYGNVVGQGIRQTETRAEARVGYELLPGLVAEGTLRLARLTDAADEAQAGRYTQGLFALRWGLPYDAPRF